MLIHTLLLTICWAGQTKVEPGHARNAVYAHVLNQGLSAGANGRIVLPAPSFVEGQTGEAQRAVLKEVAGANHSIDDLLRDSVTAPFIIRVHDVKTAETLVRFADLWYVIPGELQQVDVSKGAASTDEKEVEVANMWFQTHVLTPAEIKGAGSAVPLPDDDSSWYAHIHARLLDRIDINSTNHVMASQTAQSIVVASRTDPAFNKAGAFGNNWKSLKQRPDASPESLALMPYAGGISYVKISRADPTLKRDALLVEMHIAFVEPHAWFQGAPILRSKFSIAAQDQIRKLRREMIKKRSK